MLARSRDMLKNFMPGPNSVGDARASPSRAAETPGACAERCARSLRREDLLAEELRLAGRALGRLTGRVDVDDVLDVIFRDFCIGK